MDAPAAVEQRTADIERIRELVLVALVALIPIASGVVVWSTAGGGSDFNLRVSFSPFDVALLVMLVLALEERRRIAGWRPQSLTAWLAVALGAVMLIALVAHPSPRGFDYAFRVAALLAVVDGFRSMAPAARQRVLAAVAAVGSVEALIAIGESAKGGTVGLGPLEFTGFYYRFGPSTAAHAGFDHPYHLACFLLVALVAAVLGAAHSRRREWLGAVALIGAGLATTFSRAALVTIALLVVIAVLTGRARLGETAVRRRNAMFLGAAAFAVGVVVFWGGWHARGEATTTGQNVDSSRSERAREALRLVDEQPIVGVGPGRYTIALRDVEHTDLLPAHNVMLHAAAEGGVVAGTLAAALFVTLAGRALRRGADSTLVFACLMLFFLLDAYPYTFPVGLAVTALWFAMQEPIDDVTDVAAA